MEFDHEPPVMIEMMRWCSERVGGRDARRRRVPVLFDAFRDLITDRTPIITVTGTSGKGSTCAMLEAVLKAAGHRPGVVTKPHLYSFRERFRVDGRWVSNAELADHAARVLARLRAFVGMHGPEYRPSLFEALILVAASIFGQRGITVAVYEAAVGGANDATSFLPARYSAVTSVDLDHQNELGATIEPIAEDKAGIAPPGSTLVLGAGLSARARAVIEAVCARRDVRCVDADASALEVISADVRGQTVRLTHGDVSHQFYIPCPGSYQVMNCATVWALIRLMHESHLVENLGAIRSVGHTRLQGRFELIPGTPSWLLDVAHNPAAVAEVIATAAHHFPPGRVVVVVGVTEPHDFRGIMRVVCEWGVPVGVCGGFTRAIPADRLAAEVVPTSRYIGRFSSPAATIDHLRATPEYRDTTVLVTGSLLLVGRWRHELVRRGLLAGDEP